MMDFISVAESTVSAINKNKDVNTATKYIIYLNVELFCVLQTSRTVLCVYQNTAADFTFSK